MGSYTTRIICEKCTTTTEVTTTTTRQQQPEEQLQQDQAKGKQNKFQFSLKILHIKFVTLN